ncbi:OmpA family protein [Enterovirga rhinocerotis]|uniref:Sad1/UNC-like protein n=1 Tax=Enterovirga rhinocerotis TaxID=1339210 RepID=A0A4R7C5H9_9HYPH|nr:OmpA family protein [Enterovirga rhinocerotis]TDR93152.1 Sad1/UNC-like protein [Enterovirga rhinocerotis]
MNRTLLAVLVLGAIAFSAPRAAAQSAPEGSAPPPPEDLFAFSAGARFVQKPADADYADMAYTPYALIDETPSSETRADGGKPATYVLELPEKTELSTIVFDSAGMGIPEKSVKRLTVEVSDASPGSGFAPVLDVELAADTNDQRFELERKPVGRWVRLTFLSNHGAENYGMTGFRGYGRQLTADAGIQDVSGTYEGASGWGRVRLKQEGTRVVGCFDYRSGLIAAGVEGRLLKGEMIEHEDDGRVAKRSLALFAFAPGNTSLFALSRSTESNPDYGYDAFWSATKRSNDIGDCPGIKGWKTAAAGSQLERTLQSAGRARLDGINFDFNSATIQPISHRFLDQVADLLRLRSEWRILLEGHTDNVGSEAFNMDLSTRRAAAVRSYLSGKGVDIQRLSATGIGFGRPVASNETQAGRAQNRRVEIIREEAR